MIYFINNINDFKNILKKDNPIIVNFYALWCEDCFKINKYINSNHLNIEYKNLSFIFIDIDNSIEIRDHANINSVPTIQIYNNSNVYTNGLLTQNQLLVNTDYFSNPLTDMTGYSMIIEFIPVDKPSFNVPAI